MTLMKRSNIPNFLSVFRIFLVPLFVYLFLFAEEHLWAVIVFLAAGVTDVVDGVLARRFNWISNVGQILDPFADKCMQLAALFCLGMSGLAPWWIVAVLMLKEFSLLVGSFCVLKRKKLYVKSNWYGKLGTVAFYIISTILVLAEGISENVRLLLGVMLILFMLFALVMYAVNFIKGVISARSSSRDGQAK